MSRLTEKNIKSGIYYPLENGKTNVKEVKLNTLLSLATALRVRVRHLLPDEWGKLL